MRTVLLAVVVVVVSLVGLVACGGDNYYVERLDRVVAERLIKEQRLNMEYLEYTECLHYRLVHQHDYRILGVNISDTCIELVRIRQTISYNEWLMFRDWLIAEERMCR